MSARSKRSGKQSGGVGESRTAGSSGRASKHPARRVVKAILIGGAVAVVTRPEVRNRVLDVLFGPEEQFEYDSLTEPAPAPIVPDPAQAAAEEPTAAVPGPAVGEPAAQAGASDAGSLPGETAVAPAEEREPAPATVLDSTTDGAAPAHEPLAAPWDSAAGSVEEAASAPAAADTPEPERPQPESSPEPTGEASGEPSGSGDSASQATEPDPGEDSWLVGADSQVRAAGGEDVSTHRSWAPVSLEPQAGRDEAPTSVASDQPQAAEERAGGDVPGDAGEHAPGGAGGEARGDAGEHAPGGAGGEARGDAGEHSPGGAGGEAPADAGEHAPDAQTPAEAAAAVAGVGDGDESAPAQADGNEQPAIGEAQSPRSGWWIPRRRRIDPSRNPANWD